MKTLLGLTIISIIYLINDVDGHSHPAYNHDTNGLGFNSDWQSKLANSIKINRISIPGTHDTMADDNDGHAVDTQDSTLTKQLEAGIRVLDIRCRAYNGVFTIHHGAYYLSANFGDVLNECKNFLSGHSNEFILMRVKQEYSSESDAEFTRIFRKYWDNPTYSSYFYKTSNYNNMPSVGDVRGKIVILQNWAGSDRFGLDYASNIIQDDYKLTTNWDLYGKWEKVKKALVDANNALKWNSIPSNKFYINYLSGSFGSFPYFVASGHSNPASGAPRLATGRTTPLSSSSYPDFPRVSCFIGICTIAFEGTNILTHDYIYNKHLTFVGIIYIDFPGQGLVDRIINLNNDLCIISTENLQSVTYPSMDCWQNANYENEWDGALNANNERVYFNGLYSEHNNHREDRRFRFRYCKPSGVSVSTAGSITLPQTAYDDEWFRGCTDNSAISQAISHHDNHREDRQWTFRCTPLSSDYELTSCAWTQYVNDWDAVLNFNCPNNGLIRGIESYHDNGKEDRRYRFECCRVVQSIPHPSMDCWQNGNYENDWDGKLDANNNRIYFNGLYSEHSNRREDRRFRFRYCKPSAVSVSTAGSITLPYTNYDESWERGCGGNTAISRAISHHDNHREDRQWQFRCTPLPNSYKLTSCKWSSNYLNVFDGRLSYNCPNNGLIRTIQSYHDNNKEDRRYRFECCRVVQTVYHYPSMITSKDGNYINSWDGQFDNRQSNQYLCGQESDHDNGREDRRFKWKKCKLNAPFIGSTNDLSITEWDGDWEKTCSCVNNGNAAITGALSAHDNDREDRRYTFRCGALDASYKLVNCGMSGYLNNYDQKLNFDCPNNGVIRSISSKHDNGNEDRLWKFECCQVATADSAAKIGPLQFDFMNDLLGSESLNGGQSLQFKFVYFIYLIIGLLTGNIICFGIYCFSKKGKNTNKYKIVSMQSENESDIENLQ